MFTVFVIITLFNVLSGKLFFFLQGCEGNNIFITETIEKNNSKIYIYTNHVFAHIYFFQCILIKIYISVKII